MPDLEERTKKMMEYLEVHADDREPFRREDSLSCPAASVGEGQSTVSDPMPVGVESEVPVSTTSSQQQTLVDPVVDCSAPLAQPPVEPPTVTAPPPSVAFPFTHAPQPVVNVYSAPAPSQQDATNLQREVNSIKQELRQKQQEYQEDLEQKQQQYQKDLEERLAQQQQQYKEDLAPFDSR